MWTTPIYKFNKFLGQNSSGNKVFERIVINVTKSAPSFVIPGIALTGALKEVLESIKLSENDPILDFGAGKLRNTVYLLEKGFSVCAVEFEDQFADSKPAKDLLQKAMGFGKHFRTLIYPHQFRNSDQRFGLVLLINVINTMPVVAERSLVLQYCHEKLNPGGYVLWYTQRGDADYQKRRVPQYKISDGHYIGRNKNYKTFYREYTVAEIDSLMASAGFEFVRSVEATWRNQARLYKRLDWSPMGRVLTPKKIADAGVVDETIPVPTTPKPAKVSSAVFKRKGNPNPDALKTEALYIEQLKAIPPGARTASEYQHHVKQMLEVLFSPQELRDFELEVIGFGKTKRMDILASNKSREGFFYSLKADHGFKSPTIVIECKNYTADPKNPEFDQLGGRLGAALGVVGILAYRNAVNETSILKRCHSLFADQAKVIIPLSDKSFEKLLNFRMESKDKDIESFLDHLLRAIKLG